MSSQEKGGGAAGQDVAPEGKDAGSATTRRCGFPSCSAVAREVTKKCTACGAMWYCSRDHQRSHWKTHKVKCRGGNVAEAAPGEERHVCGGAGTEAPEGKDVVSLLLPTMLSLKTLSRSCRRKRARQREGVTYACPRCAPAPVIRSVLAPEMVIFLVGAARQREEVPAALQAVYGAEAAREVITDYVGRGLDMARVESIAEMAGCGTFVRALTASSEGHLVSGSDDKTIKLWDTQGERVRTLEGHGRYVHALTVWKGHIVSTGNDRAIKVWDEQGTCVRSLLGGRRGVHALTVWRDNLVSGSTDGSIKLWGEQSDTCTGVLKGHTHGVFALTVWESHLVSGSMNGTIKLWDAEGMCLRTIEAHGLGSVLALAVWEGYLVSGSYDKTIRFWDTEGTCVRSIEAHDGGVYVKIKRERRWRSID